MRTPDKNKRKINTEGRNKGLRKEKFERPWKLMTKEAREKSLKYSALDY
jgi:hypothetical protein